LRDLCHHDNDTYRNLEFTQETTLSATKQIQYLFNLSVIQLRLYLSNIMRVSQELINDIINTINTKFILKLINTILVNKLINHLIISNCEHTYIISNIQGISQGFLIFPRTRVVKDPV
jgi:hypothetical protein